MATNVNLVTDGDVSSDFTSSNGVKVGKVGGTEMYVPKATASQMGLVKPVEATSAMTQSVGVKSDGTLVTEPGGGGGGGSSGHTLTIASSMDDLTGGSCGNAIVAVYFADGTSTTVILNASSRGRVFSNVKWIDVTVTSVYGSCASLVSYRLGSPTAPAPYGFISASNLGTTTEGLSAFGQIIVDGSAEQYDYPQPRKFSGVTWATPESGAATTNMSFLFKTLYLPCDTYLVNQCGIGVCLLKGTRVMLSDRSEKNIEDVTYEDDLLVWDFDNGCYSSAKPVWILGNRGNRMLWYWNNVFRSGRVVRSTGLNYGHRFFEYDMCRFLPNVDCRKCASVDGHADELVKCDLVSEPCEYYNVITARHFNLFANGVLASTSLNNLYPIRDMKFVKDGAKGRGWTGKAYGNGFVEGLRLAEQPRPVAQVESYVDRLIERMA